MHSSINNIPNSFIYFSNLASFKNFDLTSVDTSTKSNVEPPNLIYQPLHSGRIWHKVNFLAEFNRFEFTVFLLLD